METIDGFPYKILGYGRCFCRGSRFRRRNRLRLNSYTFFGREGFSSCRLYPFARQAAHVRCRSDSCSAKSTSSPFGPRTKDLSRLAPRVLAVPGLDARAKKRKSGFDLCFSFRNEKLFSQVRELRFARYEPKSPASRPRHDFDRNTPKGENGRENEVVGKS